MGPQTSLGMFGTLDWGDWAYGLISGFISGGSSAVTSGFVVSSYDQDHFKFGSSASLHLMGWVFVVAGLLSAFAFLRNKPLPSVKQVETTTKRIEMEPTENKPVPPPPTVITTVKETHVEPINAPTTDGKPLP